MIAYVVMNYKNGTSNDVIFFKKLEDANSFAEMRMEERRKKGRFSKDCVRTEYNNGRIDLTLIGESVYESFYVSEITIY